MARQHVLLRSVNLQHPESRRTSNQGGAFKLTGQRLPRLGISYESTTATTPLSQILVLLYDDVGSRAVLHGRDQELFRRPRRPILPGSLRSRRHPRFCSLYVAGNPSPSLMIAASQANLSPVVHQERARHKSWHLVQLQWMGTNIWRVPCIRHRQRLPSAWFYYRPMEDCFPGHRPAYHRYRGAVSYIHARQSAQRALAHAS